MPSAASKCVSGRTGRRGVVTASCMFGSLSGFVDVVSRRFASRALDYADRSTLASATDGTAAVMREDRRDCPWASVPGARIRSSARRAGPCAESRRTCKLIYAIQIDIAMRVTCLPAQLARPPQVARRAPATLRRLERYVNCIFRAAFRHCGAVNAIRAERGIETGAPPTHAASRDDARARWPGTARPPARRPRLCAFASCIQTPHRSRTSPHACGAPKPRRARAHTRQGDAKLTRVAL